MKVEILIVGAGLAGLDLATRLHRSGRDVLLVEARQRPGGRIETTEFGGGAFDLGPAWFWAGQPRMDALIDQLGLARFEQYSSGLSIIEDAAGQLQHSDNPLGMNGTYRLDGGLQALVAALVAKLPEDSLRLATTVTHLVQDDDAITAHLSDERRVRADRVVLALPPRLVAGRMAFQPPLSGSALAAMHYIPTWMAGQAKAVAVYDTPFWREAGLSGTAMSKRGPLVEIHDASSNAGGIPALFGFVGLAPHARANQAHLITQVKDQLVRLFGPDAASPRAVWIKDWATDRLTATVLDQAPTSHTPRHDLHPALSRLWGGALMLAGSEVGSEFGGYLEGALEASERAYEALQIERIDSYAASTSME